MWETFVCDDYWPIYFGGYGCVALPKVLGRRSSLSSCMLRNILEVRQNSTIFIIQFQFPTNDSHTFYILYSRIIILSIDSYQNTYQFEIDLSIIYSTAH